MSRSGYIDDYDNWALIMWRGAVASATRGKRGQYLLRELRDALDAMPVKRLIARELVNEQGEVCALGALGMARGLPLHQIDPYEYDDIAETFNVAPALVREIEFMNDEVGNTPEQRWRTMRSWVQDQIEGSK